MSPGLQPQTHRVSRLFQQTAHFFFLSCRYSTKEIILASEPIRPTRLSTVVKVICTSLPSGVFPARAATRLHSAHAGCQAPPFTVSTVVSRSGTPDPPPFGEAHAAIIRRGSYFVNLLSSSSHEPLNLAPRQTPGATASGLRRRLGSSSPHAIMIAWGPQFCGTRFTSPQPRRQRRLG